MKKAFIILLSIFVLATAGVYYQFDKAQTFFKEKVMGDFSKKEVSTEFISHMTKVEGVQKLQLATLDQMEVITKKSRKLIFWNKLELPPVVVALKVPVRYHYYVDFEKPWQISREGNLIEVIAPSLQFDRPAADVSAIQFTLEKQSMFRNEENVKTSLLKDLTPFLEKRAEEQKHLVKEEARQQLSMLIEKWVNAGSTNEMNIVILFQEEVETQASEQN